MGQGPTDARVPKTWSLVGPSLVGMAVETVGLALGLVGPGGPDKRPFDLYSLGGKRVQVYLWKANCPAQFWWERIGITDAYPTM